MFRKIILIFALIFCLTIKCQALSAQGYALVEASTGRIIEGRNTSLKLPMASTTKIMTGLLACQSDKLDMIFTVPSEAIRVEGSSMGLQAGEKISLRDITRGLLLESGNDAANVIAYILDGSIPDFAERMNRKAEELGLTNTHFKNPSGLDDKEHYTTALDLARLGAYAMKNDEFAKIVSTYKMRIPYNGIKDGRLLVNHNRMLVMYDGVKGIKTGYTKRSGRCLVTCAQRNGITLVAATLNGHDDWTDHTILLDNGFGKLKYKPLFSIYPEISASVVGGLANTVKCSYDSNVSAVLADDELPKLKMKIHMKRHYYAPVNKGQKMGEIVFQLEDVVLGRTDIISEDAVDQIKPSRFKSFFRKMIDK